MTPDEQRGGGGWVGLGAAPVEEEPGVGEARGPRAGEDAGEGGLADAAHALEPGEVRAGAGAGLEQEVEVAAAADEVAGGIGDGVKDGARLPDARAEVDDIAPGKDGRHRAILDPEGG